MRLADLLLDAPPDGTDSRHPPHVPPELSQHPLLPLPLPLAVSHHQVSSAPPPPPLASPDAYSVRLSEDSRSSIDSLLRAASCVSPHEQFQYLQQQQSGIYNYPMDHGMTSLPQSEASSPRQKHRLHSASALTIVEKMHSYYATPHGNRHQHQHERQQSPSRINLSAHISIPATAQKYFSSSSRNSSPVKGRANSPGRATGGSAVGNKAASPTRMTTAGYVDCDDMDVALEQAAAGLAPPTQERIPTMQRPASFPLIASPKSSSPSPTSVVSSAVRRGKSVLKALDTRRRDFQCSLCDNRFLRKQDMKRHEVTHNQIKEFVCPKCGFGFVRRDALVRHIKGGRC